MPAAWIGSAISGPTRAASPIWSLPAWSALAGIARDAAPDGPVRTVTAGLYSVLGKETL